MRYFFVTLLCLFLAAPVPLALPSLAQSAEMDSIVAVVNNDVITRREVEREIVRVSANLRERELPVPDDAVVRQEALDYLIDRRLQIQLADQLGVQVPDDALEKELDRMRERLGGEKKLRQTAREKFGMSHEEFYEWVRTDIRLQALFVRAVYAQVRVSDEEVRRFLETETTVVEEREYRVARIFLKTPKDEGGREERKALAERLRGEAAEGADFAELAREHSEGEKAAEGGDLGFRREEDLPDIFVAEAANLEEGEVGRVLETGAGLHIIKLLERRGGSCGRSRGGCGFAIFWRRRRISGFWKMSCASWRRGGTLRGWRGSARRTGSRGRKEGIWGGWTRISCLRIWRGRWRG